MCESFNKPQRIRYFYERETKYLGKRTVDGVEYHAFQNLSKAYAPEIMLTQRAQIIMSDGTVMRYE